MNGVHDLGGMQGFGRIEREENEPVFHTRWEAAVYGMNSTLRAQGLYNIDQSRYAIERMEPARYLASSYYERWLAGMETNLVEKGILRREEIEARVAQLRDRPTADLPQRQDPDLAERALAWRRRLGVSPHDRRVPSRFKPGDPVITRKIQPKGHTRLPRYARGRRGVIERLHGAAPLPDARAQGIDRQGEPLYAVRFEASELWGPSAEPRECIYLDLWESYLEQEEGGEAG